MLAKRLGVIHKRSHAASVSHRRLFPVSWINKNFLHLAVSEAQVAISRRRAKPGNRRRWDTLGEIHAEKMLFWQESSIPDFVINYLLSILDVAMNTLQHNFILLVTHMYWLPVDEWDYITSAFNCS